MGTGMRSWFIVFVMLAYIISLVGCDKKHEEVILDNPFDPDNQETRGDPYNLRTEVTEDSVTLRWDAIPKIDWVAVYRSTSPDGGFVKIGTSTAGEYIDTNISPGVTYYYQFRAHRDGTLSSPLTVSVLVPVTTAPMVLIPAGEFQMGTDSSEVPQLVQWVEKWYPDPQPKWYEDESPRHTVYLSAFYMDKYEVTNALYRKFVDATGHKAPKYWWSDSEYNDPSQPVVGVSWDDAKAYVEWAGKRLPTEAEWEKAARGGLVSKKFPWGDSDPDGSQCNFADKNNDISWSDKSVDDGYQYTAPVGGYSPNGYGLYDMAGNVWEWCSDYYGYQYHDEYTPSNPTGPNTGWARVKRGGSWNGSPFHLRVANRDIGSQIGSSSIIGFRCVSQD